MTDYFLNADQASTASPKAPGVGEAMKKFIEQGAYNAARGIYEGAFNTEMMLYRAREQLNDLFDGPKVKNVIFSSGVTLALNILLYGLLKQGDHVVTTSMEHNAVMRPLNKLRQDLDISFSLAEADREGKVEAEQIAALIRSNTKLVVVTAASNVVGTRLPLAEIGEVCHDKDVLFIVDSAQLAGSAELSMQVDNIDALAFTGHKGLLGPQGIGGFLLSEKAADLIDPVICGGTGSFSHLETMPPPLPDRLEAGTLPLPAIAGLSRALDWLEETGVEKIGRHKADLTEYFLERLLHIPEIRIFGISDPHNRAERVSVISVQVENMDPSYLSQKLAEAGVLTRVGLHCAPRAHKTIGTYPAGTVRFAFAYNHTKEDIDQLVEILEKIIAAAK